MTRSMIRCRHLLLFVAALGLSSRWALCAADKPMLGAMTDSESYAIGQTVKLTALVIHRGVLVEDVMVNADVQTASMEKPFFIHLARTKKGTYEGIFVPSAAGTYNVAFRAAGMTASKLSFLLSEDVSFKVRAADSPVETRSAPLPLAEFDDIRDTQIVNPESGQPEGIRITADVTVHTPGTYRFEIWLFASNHQMSRAEEKLALSSGEQQVTVVFKPQWLKPLNVDGPYEKVDATLSLLTAKEELLADVRADAGPTLYYNLANQDKGPVYFTGQAEFTAVANPAVRTFDSLIARFQVVTPGDFCQLSAWLVNKEGRQITARQARERLAAGASSISLKFHGYDIAAAGLPGPYQVRYATLSCDRLTSPYYEATWKGQLTSAPYNASDFTAVTPDFGIAATDVVLAPGASAKALVELFGIAGFYDRLKFTFPDLPPGITAHLPCSPGMKCNDFPASIATFVEIEAASTTAPGDYAVPLHVSGKLGAHTEIVKVHVDPRPAFFTVDLPLFSPPPTIWKYRARLKLNPQSIPGEGFQFATIGQPDCVKTAFERSDQRPDYMDMKIDAATCSAGTYKYQVTGTAANGETRSVPVTLLLQDPDH